MASYLGIDIGASSVRAVLVRTSVRKVQLVAMGGCDLAGLDVVDAVKHAAFELAQKCDGVAVSLPGERVLTRRLTLPKTAQKQLAEVLPFEIEAQIPFDIAEAVFDARPLPLEKGKETFDVITTIARQDDVRQRIDLFKAAGIPEPELVVPGAHALASLALHVPALAQRGCFAILDLGAASTEVLLVVGGEVVFARTLSVGTRGLPQSAHLMARELRQTITAFRAQGGPEVEELVLAGGGSQAAGAEAFLAGELGVPATPLPLPKLDGVTPEQLGQLPRYSKALALALSLTSRSKGLNLRKGALSFERGYGFLRERIPVLGGLAAVILVSFAFSTWAELRSLSKEHDMLEDAMMTVSRDVLGEETRDPARALELLEQGPAGKDEDPLPRVDAFDVMAQLAEVLPEALKHDIEDIDVQRSGNSAPHVSIHGIVPKVTDAEELAAKLKEHPCFADVKIVKTSQQVGGDGQKYHMEWDLRCPSPTDKKPAGASSASPKASAP